MRRALCSPLALIWHLEARLRREWPARRMDRIYRRAVGIR